MITFSTFVFDDHTRNKIKTDELTRKHFFIPFKFRKKTKLKSEKRLSQNQKKDWAKIREKIELNELNELKYSNTPSQMSRFAHKHVFLYLHAQTNLNTLLYYPTENHKKSEKIEVWIFCE